MACPSCGAAAGTPYRATAAADTIHLDMRCAACRHGWQVTGKASPPLLLLKPDRRCDANRARHDLEIAGQDAARSR